MSSPIKVCVTGAAGQIAYSLLYSISKGDVFGPNQPIVLAMLDIEPMMKVMEGVCMELMDCSFDLLKEVIPTSSEEVAFKDCDAAFLVGAMPRKEGMERKDLLAANIKIFRSQGESMNKVAKKSIKVVVVGNPANTNALICSKYAPDIPKENFSCLTRLDQNRAQAQIAKRLGVPNSDVYKVTIWGNHSSTQFPDVDHAVAVVKGAQVPVRQAIGDDNWINNDFITTVQKRGAAVIAARKLSSAMSAAKATADHMRDWWMGTSPDNWVSMGVYSTGEYYGIPEGVMYSVPVRISGKQWTIVKDLSISDFAREKMDATAKELQEEFSMAMEILKA